MGLLINIILAILAFFVVRWLALLMQAPVQVAVLLGVLAAILVFVGNFAARF